MKNIHLIPTDKPSKIFYIAENFHLEKGQLIEPKSYHNVYITSDEEIKQGDWVYSETRNKVCKVTGVSKWSHKDDYSIDLDNENYYIHNSYGKKIILTTDQDLIKDGVQAIDDEFLEWFVKNPSCDSVEVIPLRKSSGWYDEKEVWHWDFLAYKIIIPQEEPKQETLEEAAEKFTENLYYKVDNVDEFNGEPLAVYNAFKKGAKWQAERMYSEEEVLDIINSFEKLCYNYQNNKDWFPAKKSEWFEQFKKK